MGNISVSLPSDGETIDAADYNTPINTIVNEINGGLDNSNIDSTAAISGAKLADNSVTSSKLDYSTLLFGNYSTSEVDTGFTWIDGKSIYKKTVSIGALPNATTKTVAHGITGYDNFIDISGWATNGSGVWTPLPYVGNLGSGNNNILIAVSGADISVQSSTDRSSYTTSYITLCYTKT